MMNLNFVQITEQLAGYTSCSPTKKILKDTWRLVVPIMETASDLFYKRLFQLKPDYREFFHRT